MVYKKDLINGEDEENAEPEKMEANPEVRLEDLTNEELREIGSFTSGHLFQSILGDKNERDFSRRLLKLEKEDRQLIAEAKSRMYPEDKIKFDEVLANFAEERSLLDLIKKIGVRCGKIPFILSFSEVYRNNFKLFEEIVNLITRDFEFDVYFAEQYKPEEVKKNKHKLDFLGLSNWHRFDHNKQRLFSEILKNYSLLYKDNFENLKQIVGAVDYCDFYSDNEQMIENIKSEGIKQIVGNDVSKLQKILYLRRLRGPNSITFLKEISESITNNDELFDLWMKIIFKSSYSANTLSDSTLECLREIKDKVHSDPEMYKILDNNSHLFYGQFEKTRFYYDLLKDDKESAEILMKNRNDYGRNEDWKTSNSAYYGFIKKDKKAGELITKYLYPNFGNDLETATFYFDLISEDTEAGEIILTKMKGYHFDFMGKKDFFERLFNLVKTDHESGQILMKYWGRYVDLWTGNLASDFEDMQKYKDVYEYTMDEVSSLHIKSFDLKKRMLREMQKDKNRAKEIVKYLKLMSVNYSGSYSESTIDGLIFLIEKAELGGEVYMEYPGRLGDGEDVEKPEKDLAKYMLSLLEEKPSFIQHLDINIRFIFDDNEFVIQASRAFKKDYIAGKALLHFYFSGFDKKSDFRDFCSALVEENSQAALVISYFVGSEKSDRSLPYPTLFDEKDEDEIRFIFDLIKGNHETGTVFLENFKTHTFLRKDKFDKDTIKFYFDLIQKDRSKTKDLVTYFDVIGSNKDLAAYIFDLLKKNKEQVCQNLKKAKDLINCDLNRAKIVEKYFEEFDTYDQKALGKFYNIYVNEGEEKAQEFLLNMKKKANGLIKSELPSDLREDDEYMLYISHVFPSGNYSNYQTNLSCGDKLEHVEGYKFKREGYPVEMSGLYGYKLMEGKKADSELLKKYTDRLEKIRTFVSSRGPDNETLQKAFIEKVDAIFKKEAPQEYQNIKDLSFKEKMEILFLNEVAKIAKSKKSKVRGKGYKGGNVDEYKANPEILDLIIEYKYAFDENLEDYIRRTADETKSFKDEESQNFNLLRELSTVYGENLKHVLRHDLFDKLEEESKNKDEIIRIFDEQVVENQNFELSEKQIERFKNTFENPRIPNEKRSELLRSQCYNVFSVNVKFKDDKAKDGFYKQIDEIFESTKGQDFFQSIGPKLLALRQKYTFDLNAKLEGLFSTDINLIDSEISKYDEITEIEKKETVMGGEKSKVVEKSSKKRKIRAYFTKTKETANARMGAYVCIAGDTSMWKNPDYFEFVMKDEESGKCVGLAMLLNINAEDGKKYLWFGPNPFEGFLGQVSSERCYKYMYDSVVNFAKENGYDGLVVPSSEGQILGACTNRGGDFPDLIKKSMLRDEKGHLKVVKYGKKHQLGGGYGYEDGALIWSAKA